MPLPAAHRLRAGGRVVIRRARPEDAEAHIANTNRIASERIFLMTERFQRTVEEIRVQFETADPRSALWLVAEVDGAIVGGANVRRGMWSKNAHTAEFGVAVLPEFRGRGIGEHLTRESLAWSRGVGIRKVRLGVFASNAAAIGLYRKLGFREEARLRDEVMIEGRPVDEILMSRWLGRPPSRRGRRTAGRTSRGALARA